MDKSKQPGINFDGIILVKENFWRDYEVTGNEKVDIDFEIKNQVVDDNATVEIISTLKLTENANEILKLESNFVGLFSVDDIKNMDLNDYIKNNAAALMFPYIREHISAVTSKAGINPIMLPPLNLIAVLNDKE